MPRAVECGGRSLDRDSEKADGWNSRQQPTFPKDRGGMQVADDGLLKLRNFFADDAVFPQKRQRLWIVAK